MKMMVALLSVVLMLSLHANSALGAEVGQQESVDQLLQAAQTDIDKQKYKDAKVKLERVLKLNRNSPGVYLLLALVYRQQDNRKEAIKQVYKTLKLQPENGEAHYLMAVLLYETNETGQASVELDKAIQLGQKAFNVFTLKGELSIAERNYKAAIESFERALQFKSSNQERVDSIRSQTESLKNYVAFLNLKDRASYTKPKPLNYPRPDYTTDARRNDIQGAVQLIAMVDKTGKVKSALLFNRLGYGLDEEALIAVSKMNFQPATKDGVPVSFWVRLDVEFRLGR